VCDALWIDPDYEHDMSVLQADHRGMPRRAVLMKGDCSPLSSHAAARTRTAAASFASQPTTGGRALLRPLLRSSHATSEPVTPARDLLSGHHVRVVIDVDGESDDTPSLYCMSCGTGIPRSAFPEAGNGAVTYTCPNLGQQGKLASARRI